MLGWRYLSLWSGGGHLLKPRARCKSTSSFLGDGLVTQETKSRDRLARERSASTRHLSYPTELLASASAALVRKSASHSSGTSANALGLSCAERGQPFREGKSRARWSSAPTRPQHVTFIVPRCSQAQVAPVKQPPRPQARPESTSHPHVPPRPTVRSALAPFLLVRIGRFCAARGREGQSGGFGGTPPVGVAVRSGRWWRWRGRGGPLAAAKGVA